MFEDIIGEPKRIPKFHIKCKECNSYNIEICDKIQSGVGFRTSDNSIYTRYRIRIKCYECNADYYTSYVE